MKRYSLLLAVLILSAWPAFAQTQEQRPGGMPGEGVFGKVTAVSSDSVTVTPAHGADPVVVKVTGDTRIMKDRQPAKVSDIKVGDTVMARGQLTGNALQARMLGVVNPDMAERMQQGGGFGRGPSTGGGPNMGRGPGAGGGPGGPQFNPEDWGKKFIAGEVKAINETKLTIAGPNNQTADVEVDENTSFRKGRESITLADIKVGDFVRGSGELKNGVFVPKELNAGRPRGFMGGGPGQQPLNDKPPAPSKELRN